MKEAAAGSIVITKYRNVEAVIKNTKVSRKQLKTKINDDENFKTMAEVNKKDIYNDKKKNQQGITKETNISYTCTICKCRHINTYIEAPY